MAISRTPVFKRCSYLGIDPIVLGYTHRPSIRRQNVKRGRKKISEYGMQLKEKQKVRFVYGVLERQFRLIYRRAESMSGRTGENLLMLLESRFDNVVYRLGFAQTRREARQMVNHGHFRLNGRRVDIPSVTMKVGDEISLGENMRPRVNQRRLAQNRAIPPWIVLDEQQLVAKMVSSPSRKDIDFEVTETAIVELYSK